MISGFGFFGLQRGTFTSELFKPARAIMGDSVEAAGVFFFAGKRVSGFEFSSSIARLCKLRVDRSLKIEKQADGCWQKMVSGSVQTCTLLRWLGGTTIKPKPSEALRSWVQSKHSRFYPHRVEPRRPQMRLVAKQSFTLNGPTAREHRKHFTKPGWCRRRVFVQWEH